MTNDKLSLDLCLTMKQLGSNNRYVFFPFSALRIEAQLKELKSILTSADPGILRDIARTIGLRIDLGLKENEKYEYIVKLSENILNNIESEVVQCFGPKTVFMRHFLTQAFGPDFHFDNDEQNGLIRMMIPIRGDTTLFSQSSDQANPGKIEALPHNSIAMWRAKHTLHSPPSPSQNPRFSILIKIIMIDHTDNHNVETVNHPSIREINEYSLANEQPSDFMGLISD